MAAGGSVRQSRNGREAAFSRGIWLTEAGRSHPLFAGRPPAFDALSGHGDEIERLPDGAVHLAANSVTKIQAAAIEHGGGVCWGVQYHPELGLGEIASSLRTQVETLVEDGLVDDEAAVNAQADLIAQLAAAPDRRDLAWRLGLDEEVTDSGRRVNELRNFIEHLVRERATARGRC